MFCGKEGYLINPLQVPWWDEEEGKLICSVECWQAHLEKLPTTIHFPDGTKIVVPPGGMRLQAEPPVGTVVLEMEGDFQPAVHLESWDATIEEKEGRAGGPERQGEGPLR
jgi:hypothetical protein